MAVTVTFQLPDDVASQLATEGRDLSRAAFEAFAVEEYRAERLSHGEFGLLLRLSRWEVDALLKAHQVWLEYTVEDFRREGEATRSIRDLSR